MPFSLLDYDNLITTGGLLLIAIVSAFSGIQIARIQSVSKAVKAVKVQLENDHKSDPKMTTNLREDLDQKHDITSIQLTAINRTLDSMQVALTGITRTLTVHTEEISHLKDKKNV